MCARVRASVGARFRAHTCVRTCRGERIQVRARARTYAAVRSTPQRGGSQPPLCPSPIGAPPPIPRRRRPTRPLGHPSARPLPRSKRRGKGLASSVLVTRSGPGVARAARARARAQPRPLRPVPPGSRASAPSSRWESPLSQKPSVRRGHSGRSPAVVAAGAPRCASGQGPEGPLPAASSPARAGNEAPPDPGD